MPKSRPGRPQSMDDGQGPSGPSYEGPGVGHKKLSGTKFYLEKKKKGEKTEMNCMDQIIDEFAKQNDARKQLLLHDC